MKTKYRIPCVWQCYGVVEIEASSMEDAIEKAKDAPLPDGDYIDDSFQVDIESLEYHNENGIKP